MAKKRAITVTLSDGKLITFREDYINAVWSESFGSRNLGCVINGHTSTASYDAVIKWLGWEVTNESLKE